MFEVAKSRGSYRVSFRFSIFGLSLVCFFPFTTAVEEKFCQPANVPKWFTMALYPDDVLSSGEVRTFLTEYSLRYSVSGCTLYGSMSKFFRVLSCLYILNCSTDEKAPLCHPGTIESSRCRKKTSAWSSSRQNFRHTCVSNLCNAL
jgi:hypothetical protein